MEWHIIAGLQHAVAVLALVMIPGPRRRRRKGHFLARPFFLFLFKPENTAVLFPSLVSRLLHPAQILNMWMSKSDRCSFIPRPRGEKSDLGKRLVVRV